MINSKFLDSNGLHISEGQRVYRNDPNNYKNNGTFLVQSFDNYIVKLACLDGSSLNYPFVYPNEVTILDSGLTVKDNEIAELKGQRDELLILIYNTALGAVTMGYRPDIEDMAEGAYIITGIDAEQLKEQSK